MSIVRAAVVDRVLPCGHTVRAAAWKTVQELRCPHLCDLLGRTPAASQPLGRDQLEAAHEARRRDQRETIARHRARGERR